MLVWLLLLLLVTPAAAADVDDVALTRLRAADPEAASTFDAAQAALDAGDPAGSEAGFEAVGKAAPRFDLTFRRLCQARLAQGKRSQALAPCRRALALEASPRNQLTMARALVALPTDVALPPEARREASQLVKAAMAADTQDVAIQRAACGVAWRNRDQKPFERCAGRLQVLAPEDPMTWYFAALSAGGKDRFGEARDHLDRAVELGLDADKAATLERQMLSHRSTPVKLASLALTAAVGWLLWLLGLFVAGSILSAMTLKIADRLPGLGPDEPLPGQAMRRAYWGVLWLCGATWYATLPLLGGVVVGVGGALAWYLFTSLVNPIPGIVVLVSTVTTLGGLTRGFFLPNPEGAMREGIDPAMHPRLNALLIELAEQVGAPRIDRVYLEPGTDLAVFQRGARRASVGRKSLHCLDLGGALLDGLRVGELKPLLAHEFGHIAANDTGRGRFVLSTRRLLFQVAEHLILEGQNRWWNPTWWFLNLYVRLYFRLSFGLSRLQEVLADRRAVLVCGSEGFASGFDRLVHVSARFSMTFNLVLDDVVGSDRILRDLYALAPARPPTDWEVKREVEKMREEAERSAYDSHPPQEERIAFARRLEVPTPPWSMEDGDPAWQLLRDPMDARKRLTATLRFRLNRAYGLDLRER